jgi:cytochrome c oxidase assembly protein subunit 15
MAHRLGALATLLYVGWLAVRTVRIGARERLCRYGVLVLVLLLGQVTLGIILALAHLPVVLAVAHGGLAALLLMSLITLNHVVRPRP